MGRHMGAGGRNAARHAGRTHVYRMLELYQRALVSGKRHGWVRLGAVVL